MPVIIHGVQFISGATMGTDQKIIERYLHCVDEIEAGHIFSPVSEYLENLREKFYLNDLNPDINLIRRLLSTRIHLKIFADIADNFESFLSPENTTINFLKAECLFVQGMIYYSKNQFQKGIYKFDLASKLYFVEGVTDRALIANFNEYIGNLNCGFLNDNEEILRLEYLKMKSIEFSSDKSLALALRQLSYYYYSTKKSLVEALEHSRLSSSIFLKIRAMGDFQFAKLFECFLLFKKNEHDLAKEIFDQVFSEFICEERVRFSYDLIRHLLYQCPMPILNQYSSPSAYWIALANEVYDDIEVNKEFKQKKFPSFESQLIVILSRSSASINYLCELLWPGLADKHQLWNRFYRLMNRTNKKNKIIGTNEKREYFLLKSKKSN